MSTAFDSKMANSPSQSEPEEEMSFEEKYSEDFHREGQWLSQRQTSGQGLFAVGGGSAFPHQRLVILSLSLLNVVLLISAVVIGIYCAKAKDLEVPYSAASPLIVELNHLRNQSGIISAKVEAQAALVKERDSHQQAKQQVNQKKTLTDALQKQIETLDVEKTYLRNNKTILEQSCGRCHPGWILLNSSCYYFSRPETASKKNWPDSRADCIRQGGDLLVINDFEEQKLINDNYPHVTIRGPWWMNGFWIGLTDEATEGTWVWNGNVTQVATMYWKDEQPSLSGPVSGHCAAFSYGSDIIKTWYSGNCRNHRLNWICEMKPSEA